MFELLCCVLKSDRSPLFYYSVERNRGGKKEQDEHLLVQTCPPDSNVLQINTNLSRGGGCRVESPVMCLGNDSFISISFDSMSSVL